jgi:hypothetical protein
MREPRRRTALTGDGHVDRHGHGCGHAEPNTSDADGMSTEVRHSVASRRARRSHKWVRSASALAVVDRRRFCVTEPVTVTVFVTGARWRGSFACCVHVGRGGMHVSRAVYGPSVWRQNVTLFSCGKPLDSDFAGVQQKAHARDQPT